MNPSQKTPKGSEQCQDDCTDENSVRKRAVSQIDRKQWGKKRDLDRFYVNSVLWDQTALATVWSPANLGPIFLSHEYILSFTMLRLSPVFPSSEVPSFSICIM